ncbi:MAG: acyl-CoA dehydrogenase family protein [Candidatus Omnitrophica bacterium]|nr:acyl-CoA dehydrogenase family protein [Candidatus Omnitrophota bacterium]
MDIIDRKKLGEEKAKSMELAEESRELEWKYPSFVSELFSGKLRWDLIHPFPEQDPEDKKVGDEFLAKLEKFLRENLDADQVDKNYEIPQNVVKGLADLGCFGMKIPKEYGGLELSKVNYNRAIGLVASVCASTAVFLSAHQSIGVPQPLLLFGTDEQKKKYLPQFAKGAVSAFALTEPNVGSDPAKMCTTAVPTEDGNYYIINGEKLWCTNGNVADILIVMAQTPSKFVDGREKKQITAFIVEKNMPGFEVAHRCSFMGLHGIQNGLLRFKNMKVPKENILWGLGQGLKLALITLNTGRLTVPAAASAVGRVCLKISRNFALERNQWGSPVGKHEAIAAKLSAMASNLFAMESVTWLTSNFADRHMMDIRLEAAMAKLFTTEISLVIANDTVQIRGGRGYESSLSLKGRGDKGLPVERIYRDARINTIIEGTSEIMHLFIAREAMDMHVRRINNILSRKRSLIQKIGAAFEAMFFYAWWYPSQWIYLPKNLGKMDLALKRHVRFVDKNCHRLARNMFHAMMKYQQGLEKKQAILFRLVDIGQNLFAMAASCAQAELLLKKDPNGEGKKAKELADLFCRQTRISVKHEFDNLFSKNDPLAYHIAQEILAGDFAWMEKDIVDPY